VDGQRVGRDFRSAKSRSRGIRPFESIALKKTVAHECPGVRNPAEREQTARLRVVVHGAVQGVGFRPFVYRLATELGLTGWVSNAAQGVFIEAEGPSSVLRGFLRRLEAEKPPRSFIQSLESSFLDPVGYAAFEVRPSEESGEKTALVLPDIATCPDCLREILDPADRRHLYPFTNCTNCGPRFTIVEALPYDRARTTMKKFAMCDRCRAEYEDPRDRRFHAQPNACPACGPHLEWWDGRGNVAASRHEALLATADAVRGGAIVAVKGLGGFHLVADARNDDAVQRLRRRKAREEKPFALMYPTLDLAKSHCRVSEMEERLLLSPEAPIVLLRRRTLGEGGACVPAPSVAPGNPYLGIMLPYTPLHHVLMRELGFPVVATSGNRADEPICTDEREALERLGGIADFFLVHNRPILRHADDSIARIVLDREMVLRRARGYAPLPVPVRNPLPRVLAVGGHLKNTVAISVGRNVFISQHVGDLETEAALAAFHDVIDSFRRLYGFDPEAVACDSHPAYLSTQFAEKAGLPVVRVQHHYAHVLACMAENEIEGSVLGVSWDGTGHGLDDTIWGGEFLRITENSFRRAAHLRTFRLPGGEKAVQEPRRTALGLLYEMLGGSAFERTDLAPLRAFSAEELRVLRRMLENGINAPLTSSAGRLFDAVSSLIGLRQVTRFEGQSAMALEFALEETSTDEEYPFRIDEESATQPENENERNDEHEGEKKNDGETERKIGDARHESGRVCYRIDWEPMIRAILEDAACGSSAQNNGVAPDGAARNNPVRQDARRNNAARPREDGTSVGRIAARFHNTLAGVVVAVAERVGEERVVLTGGCFQNKYLTERCVARLRAAGFRSYWHQRVPPNDGCIALGQIMAAARAEHSARNKRNTRSTNNVSGCAG